MNVSPWWIATPPGALQDHLQAVLEGFKTFEFRAADDLRLGLVALRDLVLIGDLESAGDLLRPGAFRGL